MCWIDLCVWVQFAIICLVISARKWEVDLMWYGHSWDLTCWYQRPCLLERKEKAGRIRLLSANRFLSHNPPPPPNPMCMCVRERKSERPNRNRGMCYLLTV